MATVPIPADFAGGVLATTDANAKIRDPLRFLMSRPIAYLRQTSAQSIASGGAGTALTFNTEIVDQEYTRTLSHHDNVTNNSRFTAQYPGWYGVCGMASFAANATGRRAAWIRVNGTDINGSANIMPGTAAGVVAPASPTILVSLAAGDYIEVVAFQDSGGALNTSVGSIEQPIMTVTYASIL